MSVHAGHRDSVAAYSSFLSQGRLPTWKRSWARSLVVSAKGHRVPGLGMELSFPELQF